MSSSNAADASGNDRQSRKNKRRAPEGAAAEEHSMTIGNSEDRSVQLGEQRTSEQEWAAYLNAGSSADDLNNNNHAAESAHGAQEKSLPAEQHAPYQQYPMDTWPPPYQSASSQQPPLRVPNLTNSSYYFPAAQPPSDALYPRPTYMSAGPFAYQPAQHQGAMMQQQLQQQDLSFVPHPDLYSAQQQQQQQHQHQQQPYHEHQPSSTKRQKRSPRPRLRPEQLQHIRQLAGTKPYRDIAAQVGCSVASVARYAFSEEDGGAGPGSSSSSASASSSAGGGAVSASAASGKARGAPRKMTAAMDAAALEFQRQYQTRDHAFIASQLQQSFGVDVSPLTVYRHLRGIGDDGSAAHSSRAASESAHSSVSGAAAPEPAPTRTGGASEERDDDDDEEEADAAASSERASDNRPEM